MKSAIDDESEGKDAVIILPRLEDAMDQRPIVSLDRDYSRGYGPRFSEEFPQELSGRVCACVCVPCSHTPTMLGSLLQTDLVVSCMQAQVRLHARTSTTGQ